jgi:dihydrofolate reductase
MPRFRMFLAASLDGFIAEPDHSVRWLDPFQTDELGFDAFIAGIHALVMGRATYAQVRAVAPDWPYSGRKCYVVTSRPLDEPPIECEPWHLDMPSLVDHLKDCPGDVWVVGGSRLNRAFLSLGLIDSIELFTIPVILGAGIPIFAPGPAGPLPKLVDSWPARNGVVKSTYTLRGAWE